MNKIMNFMVGVLAVLIMAVSAGAQMMGGQDMMRDQGRQQERISQVQPGEPDMMYPGGFNCFGMGPGMMGGYGVMPGFGMGPGMIGGYGMMHGYGMGPGMMGGYGMGHMNLHMLDEHGWGRGRNRFRSPGDYDKFLDETKDLRKKLHDMRFEYGEMMRDPKTTVGDLQKKQQEMAELQQEIFNKYGQ